VGTPGFTAAQELAVQVDEVDITRSSCLNVEMIVTEIILHGHIINQYVTAERSAHVCSSFSHITDPVEFAAPQGGPAGPCGRNGKTPPDPLQDGLDGDHGFFHIEVGAEASPYEYRYNLRLGSVRFESRDLLGAQNFQFGAVVYCKNIQVENIGGMPTPLGQRAMILICPGLDSLISEFKGCPCFTQRRSPIKAGETSIAEGALCFQVIVPDMRTKGDDLDPYVHKTRLRLEALQLGPETPERNGINTSFQRPFTNFHDGEGFEINFGFPVANNDGIRGMKILGAGDSAFISFELANIGPALLGNNTRNVCVQFYRSSHQKYSTPSNDLVFRDSNKHVVDIEPDMDAMLRGNIFFIESLPPGKSLQLKRYLTLCRHAKPYSKFGVQAEILLEDFTSTGMFVVQRRLLEVIVEPAYEYNRRASVVLVTSTTTTELKFHAWKELLTIMGLQFECYSVSRYGSLSPDYEVEKGLPLKNAFRNKLVVLLNEGFALTNKLAKSAQTFPVSLLPNGCMMQSSGFDDSTMWLIVNSKGAVDPSLLESLLCYEDEVISQSFQSVNEYKNFIREQLKSPDSFDKGIVSYNITVKTGEWRLKQVSRSLCQWLKKKEPLRQHQVDVVFGASWQPPTITILHGYSRVRNSAVVATVLNSSDEYAIVGPSMCLALSKAMAPAMRVETFYECLKRTATPTYVLEALKDASTTAFLWDVANLVDSSGQYIVLPSLEAWRPTPQMISFLNSINNRQKQELHDLATRFTCIANSKDMRPWWNPCSFNCVIRNTLESKVEDILPHWGIDDPKDLVKSQMELKKVVKRSSHKDHQEIGFRTHCRWRKGLMYLHSSNNTSKYGSAVISMRVVDLKDSVGSTDGSGADESVVGESLRFFEHQRLADRERELHARRRQTFLRLNSIQIVQQEIEKERSRFSVSIS